MDDLCKDACAFAQEANHFKIAAEAGDIMTLKTPSQGHKEAKYNLDVCKNRSRSAALE